MGVRALWQRLLQRVNSHDEDSPGRLANQSPPTGYLRPLGGRLDEDDEGRPEAAPSVIVSMNIQGSPADHLNRDLLDESDKDPLSPMDYHQTLHRGEELDELTSEDLSDFPLSGQEMQRLDPGDDDGQVETPGGYDLVDRYLDGLAEEATRAAAQPAESDTASAVAAERARLSRELVASIAASVAKYVDRDTPPPEALPPEELRRLTWETGSTINHTLARVFLMLGPPPEGAGGDLSPVSSGGGGAQQ